MRDAGKPGYTMSPLQSSLKRRGQFDDDFLKFLKEKEFHETGALFGVFKKFRNDIYSSQCPNRGDKSAFRSADEAVEFKRVWLLYHEWNETPDLMEYYDELIERINEDISKFSPKISCGCCFEEDMLNFAHEKSIQKLISDGTIQKLQCSGCMGVMTTGKFTNACSLCSALFCHDCSRETSDDRVLTSKMAISTKSSCRNFSPHKFDMPVLDVMKKYNVLGIKGFIECCLLCGGVSGVSGKTNMVGISGLHCPECKTSVCETCTRYEISSDSKIDMMRFQCLMFVMQYFFNKNLESGPFTMEPVYSGLFMALKGYYDQATGTEQNLKEKNFESHDLYMEYDGCKTNLRREICSRIRSMLKIYPKNLFELEFEMPLEIKSRLDIESWNATVNFVRLYNLEKENDKQASKKNKRDWEECGASKRTCL